jgi:hypothetical protein
MALATVVEAVSVVGVLAAVAGSGVAAVVLS